MKKLTNSILSACSNSTGPLCSMDGLRPAGVVVPFRSRRRDDLTEPMALTEYGEWARSLDRIQRQVERNEERFDSVMEEVEEVKMTYEGVIQTLLNRITLSESFRKSLQSFDKYLKFACSKREGFETFQNMLLSYIEGQTEALERLRDIQGMDSYQINHMLEELRPGLLERESAMNHQLELMEEFLTSFDDSSQKLKDYFSRIQKRILSLLPDQDPAEEPPTPQDGSLLDGGSSSSLPPTERSLGPPLSPAEPYIEVYKYITRILRTSYRFLNDFMQYLRESFWE